MDSYICTYFMKGDRLSERGKREEVKPLCATLPTSCGLVERPRRWSSRPQGRLDISTWRVCKQKQWDTLHGRESRFIFTLDEDEKFIAKRRPTKMGQGHEI